MRYVGTACPRTPWSDADREWLEAKGVRVQYRASLEQDLAAMREFEPDLAIGTTPVVQKAKAAGDPGALLHQPDLGAAADGRRRAPARSRRWSTRRSATRPRFDAMKEFFAGVGEGDAAGVWEDTPRDRAEFRERYRRQLAAQAKKREAEEMGT